MSNKNCARVLNRMGAHELTKEDVEKIMGSGGNVHTRLTDFMTGTASNPDHTFDE
jgi:hypothetical protein